MGERAHGGLGHEEDAQTVEAAGSMAKGLTFADARDRAGREAAHARDRRERRRPAHAVGRRARVALELAQRGLGLGSEDPVLAPGVEAERVQPTLELGDVVAAQHGSREVEEPVAELEAALDERAPGLRAADAVDSKAAHPLKIAHGGLEPVVEDVAGRGARSEPGPEVEHRCTAVAPSEYDGIGQSMNSASSSSSWGLPLAPTRRFFTSPSAMTSSVGMLMTS